ncbi:MAG: FAD-dependent monooxygenase [Hyphomicrobiaceae bacterium]
MTRTTTHGRLAAKRKPAKSAGCRRTGRGVWVSRAGADATDEIFESASARTRSESCVEKVDTLIIGAGQAGVVMSHELSKRGQKYVIVERGRIAERWRTERWDGLHFQTPNLLVDLPGYPLVRDNPNGFAKPGQVHRLPISSKAMRLSLQPLCRRVLEGQDVEDDCCCSGRCGLTRQHCPCTLAGGKSKGKAG